MESSGPTPSGGLGAADLPELARLFDEPGPFVTVYLHTPAEIDNAAQRSELEWKNVRRELAEAGAPEPVLDAIDPLVPDAHLNGQTLAVVANAGGLLLQQHHPDPPTRELWRIASLPSVGPLVEWAQMSPPHLLVLADRSGADIVAVVRGEHDVTEEVQPEDPHDPVLRKSKPGGWSQRRYQQRAENQWEKDAKEVADRVVGLCDEIGARLVVVAGDVRALEKLRSNLPERVLSICKEVEGSRAVDGGIDELADEAVRMVATVVAEDTVALLEKFKEERGQGDRAADGPARTLEALAGAQVDTLLIADDPDDARTASFGPVPNMVGLDGATVKDMGVDNPQEGRLVDVCIRAAFGTGATVRLVPSHAVTDGVGAILRFTTTPGS
jgi:peptide subunit release factor 1 (eRF1)